MTKSSRKYIYGKLFAAGACLERRAASLRCRVSALLLRAFVLTSLSRSRAVRAAKSLAKNVGALQAEQGVWSGGDV